MKNWKYIEGAKTGNGILDILKSEKPIKMKSSKGEIVTIHPDGSAAHQDKEGSQMAVHHYNSFKEAVEYYKNQGYVKVGNISASITTDGNTWFVTTSDGKKEEFTSEREAEAYVKKIKTGNDTPWEYAHRKPKVINDDKTGAEEFFKKLSDDVKEREEKDDADIEKVGNATPNYRYKDFLITNPEGHEYIVFLKDGRTVGYRGTTSKAQAEDWCDWHDPKTGKSIGNKTGNSAQDDKFAYVMREFDEGKLKTPDGKVVTDPAQAKAIAYSESKKTENGLARARNAIKKS